MDPIFVTGPPGGFVSADRTSTGGKSAGGGVDLSYFAWRGTVATCCSHSRRSSPAPPPLSVRVYFRVSTGAGGLLNRHLDATEIGRRVVCQSPLSGLFADDQLPLLRIFDPHIE